jgi:tetratricopeptide (TPR) repeat protein
VEPFDLIDELRGKHRHTRTDVNRLRQMSERNPHCAKLWDVLGDLQQVCVDHAFAIDEFLACYRKAVECDPEDATAHVSLGSTYDAHLEDFANAAKHFRIAINLGAGDTAHIGLASVLAQLGEAVYAIAQLDPEQATH